MRVGLVSNRRESRALHVRDEGLGDAAEIAATGEVLAGGADDDEVAAEVDDDDPDGVVAEQDARACAQPHSLRGLGQGGAEDVDVEGFEVAGFGGDFFAFVVTENRRTHRGCMGVKQRLENRAKRHASIYRVFGRGARPHVRHALVWLQRAGVPGRRGPSHREGCCHVGEGGCGCGAWCVVGSAMSAPPGSLNGFADFLATARVEVARYGDEDDVFIREMVQNARDAFARTILFSRQQDGDVEVVVVEDDGSGMARDVVTGALLRLFSSQKDREEGAAGCFGVGFWSVLRFADVDIVVDTHTGKAGCGLCIDLVHGTLTERPARRKTRGTTVTLRRRRRAEPFALRQAILHHASLVTGKGGPPPRLELAGEVLNRTLKLSDDVLASRTIEGSGFRGVVGLSATPRIELFHHGLRVVEASSLLALVPSRKRTAHLGLGLSAKLDVAKLTVLVDRKTVVEDDALRAVVDACDVAARRLEREVLDAAAPLRKVDLVLWQLRRLLLSAPVRLALTGMLTVVIGGVLGFSVLWLTRPELRGRIALPSSLAALWPQQTPSSPGGPVTAQPLDNALAGFTSPRIDVRGQNPGGWDVDVEGVGSAQLRLFALSLPDARRGLRAAPLKRDRVAAVDVPASARVALRVGRAGPLTLPSSTSLWPVAVIDDGVRRFVKEVGADGLPLYDIVSPGVITVELAPLTSMGATARPDLIDSPSPALRDLVAPLLLLPAASRVDALVVEVQRRIRYAADEATSVQFDADNRDFVDKALAIGRGDCDVINAVLVRALLAMGEEARLAVGLVVVDDVVADDLHAWAERRRDDGTWETLDASPPEARPRPVSAASAALARAETPRATPAPAATPLVKDEVVVGAVVVAVVVVGSGIAAVVWQLRKRRRRRTPRPWVLPLFLAGLQSGAAERLGLRRRPFLPTLSGQLLSLDDCARRAASGRLAVGGSRPPWLHRRVAVLDVADERVRALRPHLPRLAELDGLVLSEPAGLTDLQRQIDACFVGVELHAGNVDRIVECHLRAASGATHLVVVPEQRLTDADLLTTLRAQVTCLRGLP